MIMQSGRLVCFVLSLGLLAAGPDARAAAVLWNTGAPQLFYFGTVENYWGYGCGNIAATGPQTQFAAPFAITGGSATLTQISADWVDSNNTPGQLITYTIWSRTGLNAPVNGNQVSSGTLGSYATGSPDPRAPACSGDPLHAYAVNITLPAGNYYLSISSSGSGYNELDWLGGANLQPTALEWNGFWRSDSFPSPGFFADSPASVTAPATMTDPLNRWNVSFAIDGYVSLLWTGTGSNSNWSTAANWGGSTPSSSNSLEFGSLTGNGNSANVNDLTPGSLFQGISFLPGAKACQLSGNSISLNGNLVNQSSASQTIGLALALAASGTSFDTGSAGLTVNGSISGTGGITKLGSGRLLLSGSNSYTGGTTIANGTLVVSNSAALGPSGALTFSGGTLQYQGTSTDFSSRIAPIAANQSVAIDTGGEVVDFAGNIAGGGSLLKLGAGELILSGANSYTGGTIVAQGTLEITRVGSLPSGGLTVGSQAMQLFGSSAEEALQLVDTPGSNTARPTSATTDTASMTLAGSVTSVPEAGTVLMAISGGLTFVGYWLVKRVRTTAMVLVRKVVVPG